MNDKIVPVLDYVLGKKIEKDRGAVTNTEIRDTHQLFEVLAVGPGGYEYGIFIPIDHVSVGDLVWVQKHSAEGDTPADLNAVGLALFKANRIMAKEKNNA